MKLTLTPDERVEYEALIRQAVGADSGDKIVRDVAHEILDLLHDAEQAGRTWAARVVSDLTEIGARNLARKEIKRATIDYTAKSGTTLAMSSRAGVRRDDEYQQVLFGDMTRTDIDYHVALLDKQLTALGARKGALKRLAAVMDEHPECATVAEALAADGRSMTDVLGIAA